jgi:hyaluronan synthase
MGIPLHVGDDRVLTNELLRNGWRTVYQSTAVVSTDAPSDWRTFWKQQLRWGRSSQRETLLSLPWLWKKPVAFVSFVTDIVTPFALYAVAMLAVAHAARGEGGPTELPLALNVPVGYAGMLVSIGVRQIPHFRRTPRDIKRLPIFVLQLTFLIVPIRIAAFATMLHQGWSTRPSGSGAHSRGAAARAWVPAAVPRLAALLLLASAAAPAAMLASASRAHTVSPASAPQIVGQEVILEAPVPKPRHG